MSEFSDFDFDGDDAYRPSFLVKPLRRVAPAINPLACYTDDELLCLPGDIIANVLRETSIRGREFVNGDTAPSNWAVVRVPDHEATTEDFRPHLDWSDANDVVMDEQGRYPVNLSFASHAIAPRIAEPHLPAQTRISGHALENSDIPMPPVERTLLRAAQAIQLMRKADGDYRNLATLMGKAWGDEALFDPDEPLDLLGDLSLPRVLAKSGKRRFEMYRNIGFTSVVSAGVNQATSAAYGDSAIINWQRRTELAKSFLHFAIVLEGKHLPVGARFSITARIPFSSVPHRTWYDLAMECDPQHLIKNALPHEMVIRARNFVRNGLRSALRIVSTAVRAAGMDVEWGDKDTVVAQGFDRLIYRETLRENLKTIVADQELAAAKRHDQDIEVKGTFKAHDPRVAMLELLETSGMHRAETNHVLSLLSHASKMIEKHTTGNRVHVVKQLGSECLSLVPYAKAVANRPESYEKRHAKAEWSRICADQLPPELIAKDDPYHPMSLIQGLIHAELYDKSSQVHRTIAYQNAMLNQQLDAGIRSKQAVLKAKGTEVELSIRKDMLNATRIYYRDRYRRKAIACGILSNAATSVSDREVLKALAAREYARADAAVKTNLGYIDGKPNIRLPDKRLRAVMALYAYNLRSLGFPTPPHFIEMTVGETMDWMTTTYEATLAHLPDICRPEEVMAAHQRFIDAHQADHDAVTRDVPVEEPKIEDVQNTMDEMEDLFGDQITNTATSNLVDDMVSYWIATAADLAYLDEDEADELADWVTENIDLHVVDVASYIETHSSGHDPRSANELIEFWTDLKELEEDVIAGAKEIC